MVKTKENSYYIERKAELLKEFDAEVKIWSPIVHGRYGEIGGYKILSGAREAFEKLIPKIPYIGGEENRLTANLVESVWYLALYQSMKEQGWEAEDAGRIIYDACLIKNSKPQPPIPPSKRLTKKQLHEVRRQAAEKTQERKYPGDYVFSYVIGDGKKFDYGYDFTQCASLKFYGKNKALEFLPYYCYLDFIACKARGIGFTRTLSQLKGQGKCNHRFKEGGVTKAPWPPPFAKRKSK